MTTSEKGATRKWLIPKDRVTPVGMEWRKRVGVEPTRRPSRSEHAGFEDQEGHRAPCASGRILRGGGAARRGETLHAPDAVLRPVDAPPALEKEAVERAAQPDEAGRVAPRDREVER